MEGNLIGLAIHSKRVVSARRVQEENVKAGYRRHQERHQEVKSEETSEGRVVHREPASEPSHQPWTKVREGGK